MPYALGVDLGTTFTAAAAVHADGRVEMVALTPHRPAVPTVVALDADGRWLVGEPAERRGRSAPDRMSREFKRRLGDPAPILLAGSPATADLLLGVVLSDVVGTATRTLGEPPRHITITHPATWAAHKLSLLSAAVAAAGIGRDHVTFLPEPIAAARHYAATERVTPGTVLAVYDLGGGTFDAAVLERTATGFQFKGRPEGLEHAGGLDVDQAVLDHVDDALGGALSRLDRDDPELAGPLASLRAECVQAKEALSSDADTTVSVVLPGLLHSVRITRGELERRIEPMLRDTVEALDRAIAAAGVSPVQIDRILLVGGSSRIPLVAQLLAARFGRPIVVDAHPKHAVALGAAAVAAAQAFASTVPVSTEAVPAAAAAAVPSHPDATPAPAPDPTGPRSGRMKVIAGVVAAALIAAAVGVLASRAGDDDDETTTDASTTTTTEGTTSTTAAPAGGDDRYPFPSRPIGEAAEHPAAGLRGGLTFEGVDPAFLERVEQIDPAADDAGIVAETYDAVVSLQLAARQSGHDGSAVAAAVVAVTRTGTLCETPAACLEVIGSGGEPDYDGQSGRIELADVGERTSGRIRMFEAEGDGTFGEGLLEEVDVPELLDIGTAVRSDRRADDGVLRVGGLVNSPSGTAANRMAAASQLAVDDVAAAGGIGIPVELLAPVPTTQVPDDDALVVAELVRLGVDAVVTTALDPGVSQTITDAGILILQVTPTPALGLITPEDVEPLPPGAEPGDGGLRFGFGPSRLVYTVLVARQLVIDGCTDVAIVAAPEITVNDGELERELWELILDENGLAVEVAQLESASQVDPDAIEPAIELIVDTIDEGTCVVWADDDAPLEQLIAGTVDAGVGPSDTFHYVEQTVIGLQLVDDVAAAVDGG